jgi:excisionase family DNA binding protein
VLFRSLHHAFLPHAAAAGNRRSSAQAAARLKVQERTVRDWILRGELQAYKIGKEWRIRRDHFDEAMEARRVSTDPTRSGGLWDPDAA